jgi:hypothetical protein
METKGLPLESAEVGRGGRGVNRFRPMRPKDTAEADSRPGSDKICAFRRHRGARKNPYLSAIWVPFVGGFGKS